MAKSKSVKITTAYTISFVDTGGNEWSIEVTEEVARQLAEKLINKLGLSV